MSAQLKVAKVRSLGYQGDPGLFGSIGKAITGAARVASGFIPGGSLVSGAINLLTTPRQGLPVPTGGNTLPGLISGAVKVGKYIPFIKPGMEIAKGFTGGVSNALGFGKPRKRYRRMNPLNPKALNRSIRRVGKFQEFARSVGFSRAPARMKGVHPIKRRRRRAA